MSAQLRTKEQALQTITELVKKHLPDYKTQIIQRGGKKTTVANCNTFYKMISFVEHFAIHLSERDFIETILHEIAHGLTPGHGHDGTFKRMCRRIGGQEYSKVNYSYALESAPDFLQKKVNYIYKCPACGKETKTTRILKRETSCGRCSPRFDRRFLLVLAVNLKQPKRLQGFSLTPA